MKQMGSKSKNMSDVDGSRVSVKLQLPLAQSECEKDGWERDDVREKPYSQRTVWMNR